MINKRMRRARAALLWCLLGLISLQLGLFMAVENWLPELRDSFYASRANILGRRTRTSPKPVTVLMLGSSRTQSGFRANTLEKSLAPTEGRPVVVFNFGQPCAGPMTELLYLKRLLTDGIRPDLLLIEVLSPVLCDQCDVTDFDEVRQPVNRLRLDDLALVERYGGPLRKHVRREWWESSLVPWYSRRFAILSCIAPPLVSDQSRIQSAQLDESGCLEWSSLENEKCSDAQRRRALEFACEGFKPYLAGFRLGGRNCDALRELLDLCRDRKISAAMVLMPEGPEFRSWYAPGARDAIEAFLAELSRAYRTPVFNCTDWMPEQEFLDSHHLLERGSGLLTQRLLQEAILPLLRQEPVGGYGRPAPDRMAAGDKIFRQ